MKKTLLIAAATLATSVISSQAGVYSQNIVGYVNLPTSSFGTYLMTVPFLIGQSNGANEIWPLQADGVTPTLPDGSELEIWTGSGISAYFSDSGSSSLWDDASQTPIPNAPVLLPGEGFFLIPSGDTTNTFAGAVAVQVGSTNNTFLSSFGTFCVAPAIPYGGSVTNGNGLPSTNPSFVAGPGLSSLNGLPDGSELEIWTGSGITAYFSDSGSQSLWDDASQSPIDVAPTISVGQGFFLIPSADWTWTVGL